MSNLKDKELDKEFDIMFPTVAMTDLQRAYVRNIKEFYNQRTISKKMVEENMDWYIKQFPNATLEAYKFGSTLFSSPNPKE